MHTLGASGKTWLPRIKCISYIYSTIIMLMFAAVVVKRLVSDKCPTISKWCKTSTDFLR